MAGSDCSTSLREQPPRPEDRDVSLEAASVVATVVVAVAGDPADEHSLPAMARRARVSPRHLARLFGQHLLCSPVEFVERVRVAAACRLLSRSDQPISSIAGEVGFTSRETMRRAFLRRVGVPPGVYRQRALDASGARMAGSEGSLSLPPQHRRPTIETCTSSPE